MKPLTLGDFTVPKWDPERARREIERHSLGSYKSVPYHKPSVNPGYRVPSSGLGNPVPPPWLASPGYGIPSHQPGIGSPQPLTFTAQPEWESSTLFPSISSFYDKATNSISRRAREAVEGIVPQWISPNHRRKAQDLAEELIRENAQQFHPNQWPTFAVKELKKKFGPGTTLTDGFAPYRKRADQARWFMNQSAQQNRGGPNTRHPLFQQGQSGALPPEVPPQRGFLNRYLPDFMLEFKTKF